MCRSIKVLRRPEHSATDEEVRSAALQFVRKISGFHKPSQANQAAFEQAVQEISEASDRLLKTLRIPARQGQGPAMGAISEVPAAID